MNKKHLLESTLSIKSNKEIATLYSEIEYSIYLENKLGIDMNNLSLIINIPKGTKYKENSLCVNDKKQFLDSNKVFKIPIFKSGYSLRINYTVCVEDIPHNGSINNHISLKYYEDDNILNEIISKEVITKVKGVKLDIIKEINKKELYINDDIIEKIKITNSGNIKAVNLIVEELLPENIEIESIIIDNVKFNNEISVPVGVLEPLKSVEIIVLGKVIGVNNVKENLKTLVTYDYFDDYTYKYRIKNSVEKSIPIYVREGHFGVKSIEKNSLTLSSNTVYFNNSITLDFKVYNIGNIPIEKLNIKLKASNNIGINNIVINDRNIEDENIFDGIKLNKFCGEELSLKSKVYIQKPDIEEKNIKIILEYEYFNQEKGENVKKLYESNEVKLVGCGVVLNNLNGEIPSKECNKKICTIGDCVTYYLNIKNNGNKKCENLIFKEEINSNSEFVKDSFKINNKIIKQANIYDGIDIGLLDIGESVNITYKLRVKESSYSDWLISTSHLEYEENQILKKIDITFKDTRIIYSSLVEIEDKKDICYYKKEDKKIYYITLKNLGNVAVEDVKIKLKKSNNIKFLNIKLDERKIESSYFNNEELIIPIIKKDETKLIEIEFDTISYELNDDIRICGEVSYSYLGVSNKTIYNTLILQEQQYKIVYGEFNAKTIIDKPYFINNKEINGFIEVNNTGNVDLYDIEFISYENKENINLIIEEKSDLLETLEVNKKLIVPIKINLNDFNKKNNVKFNLIVKGYYKFQNEEIMIEKRTEELYIEIINEELECYIESSKNNFFIEEIANFKIIIKNMGNHDLEETFLNLYIPKEIEIIQDKINIRNNSYNELDIRKGIIIGKILANEELCIEYLAKVKELNVNRNIITYYKIGGYYKLSFDNKKLYKEYNSETLTNKIENVSLKTFLTSDKNVLLNGEKIKYTSTLINNGTVPIKIDYRLENGMELEEVKDLTTLNGEYVNNICGLIKIKPNDGLIIEKVFKYNGIRGSNDVVVNGIATVYYETDDHQYERYTEIKTEEVAVEITNRIFKELLLEEMIDISVIKPKIYEITKIYLTPTIMNKNVRKIQRNYDYDSKEIIAYKLDIIGQVQYTVEYISNLNNEEIHLFSTKKIFTSNMLLPYDFMEGEEFNIDIKILDINSKIIDKNKMFINANILINTNI
ncbi:DUF11 domain-containing protein [Clostridium weizhouense]|uniref:DUF11 domain-containing protein n=1 Tax=Clostridium weizhouense TaxID=2859781 RepID=A0ABS7AKS2_9CLOT|nr:DUF11 domain-containing protein [Clostridium weizhouense]MBW6409268.1 hypothetical protein [Clostridium weizhouense]